MLIRYIRDFHNEVAEVPAEKYRSILDGMLFEVFFNSKGELRKGFKVSRFNDLFELRNIPEFAPSFEFVAEVLLTHQNRFYVIPGKQRSVSVDVVAEQSESGESLVTGVFFEGINVLRKTGSNVVENLGAYPVRYEKLVQTISNEMVIPLAQLTVNVNFDPKSTKILFPHGSTLEK